MVYFEFIKNRHYFYAWSTLVVLAGLLLPFTTRFQLRWGLDFVGGTEFLIRCEKGIGDDPIRKALENKELVKLEASMQRVTGGSFVGDAAVGSSFIVRTKLQPDEIRGIDDKLVRVLSKELGQKCERQATNSIGPVVGESLMKNTRWAVMLSCLVMLLYMAFRFEWRPGVACTISLFHDTLAIIAVCCIFHVEIDITVVAAILTVLGYSTNDSIVILDRVRENLRLKRKLPYEELVNLAINQCLVRTIYNSMTTMLPLLALLTVGPSSLWGFSLVLLVGVFEGCYSTFGVVCPICVDWHLYVDKPRQRTDVASQKA